MVKKVVTKTVTKTVHDDDGSKKTTVKDKTPKDKPKKKKMTAREREELLIENFVGLQHAMTNLSIKFGTLSDNITKLLMVFEESAKNFMQGGKGDDKDLLKKINSLLDQNKTIAKGLVLMEGKLRGRSDTQPMPQAAPMQPSISTLRPKPKPLPSA
ncbi:hypothetical protein HOA55_03740 [archaeon]|jgi:hypothetical protein|nr:hypothetical protein [archaeon]MBT3577316.1 hypothetical protein [archaeon]MBT6820440.1 hypothetical protein [archaeon]MBT6956265.1 hypothetical protein [archaeon]MBT7025254.1 hypothetical protein [archaeon]